MKKKIINWGIIGCGEVVKRRIAPAVCLSKNSKLYAFHSRDIKKSKQFATLYGAEKYYNDIDEMLEDSFIDAVYVATPHFLHCEQVINSARHKKHVLCEKIMAMNSKECDMMIKACKDNNVKLGVAYYRRFFQKNKEIKKLIGQNVLGKINSIHVTHFGWMYPSGKPGWYFDSKRSGGGILMNYGCHYLDLLIFYLGLPIEVTGVVRSREANDKNVEDIVNVIIKFKNDIYVYFNFNGSIKDGSGEVKLEIFGEKGYIITDMLGNSGIKLRIGEQEKYIGRRKILNSHLVLVNDFSTAIMNNTEPFISGKEGIKTSFLIDAIYESSKKKRTINKIY